MTWWRGVVACGDGQVPKGDCRQQNFGKIRPRSGSVRTCVYQEADPVALALVFFLMERLIFPLIFAKKEQLGFDSW